MQHILEQINVCMQAHADIHVLTEEHKQMLCARAHHSMWAR